MWLGGMLMMSIVFCDNNCSIRIECWNFPLYFEVLFSVYSSVGGCVCAMSWLWVGSLVGNGWIVVFKPLLFALCLSTCLNTIVEHFFWVLIHRKVATIKRIRIKLKYVEFSIGIFEKLAWKIEFLWTKLGSITKHWSHLVSLGRQVPASSTFLDWDFFESLKFNNIVSSELLLIAILGLHCGTNF